MGTASSSSSNNNNSKSVVVVDVREFRSQLPCALFSRGLEVVPKTLEVADYILTPDICVERKSLSDLFSSFQSGRLYTQVRMRASARRDTDSHLRTFLVVRLRPCAKAGRRPSC